MLHKIKITAKGWETFSSHLCQVKFQDGVSEHALPRLMIDRIAALVQCELLDEEGNPAGQAGGAARYVNSKPIRAEVKPALERMTEDQVKDERREALERALKNPAQKLYSEKELQDLADKEGIKGLRVIGDLWNVRERSINKLIEEILRIQNEYLARVEERKAEEKRKRDEALEAAKAIQQAREAAIDAQARIVGAKPDDPKPAEPAIDPAIEQAGREQSAANEEITAEQGE